MPLCLHKDGNLYYNGDVTLFETLGEVKQAINSTITRCLQAKKENPNCETGHLETFAKYWIRHARYTTGVKP